MIPLLISTPRSMMDEVAMKISLGKLNAESVIPRIAPPVPAIPAKKPEKAPPIYRFESFC